MRNTSKYLFFFNFQINAHVPDTVYGALIDIDVIVAPFIVINSISVLTGEKTRLTSSFVSENPTQLKLNRYNPKITIAKKPKYGKIKKITRNSGEIESLKDKEITSFTYKELKSGVVYYVSKKISPDILSINDSFEYILSIKSVQPGQRLVPIEIYSPNKRLYSPNNDMNVIAADTGFPSIYMLIISVAAGLIAFLVILVVVLRCRNSGTAKSDPDKDLPPPLPRPPDFMTLNNNRMYSSSDGDSIPVTASSTPLPILSNVPHCKVYPIGIENEIPDSESEDNIPELSLDHVQQNPIGRYPYGEESEGWSSSCDIGNDVSYSNVAQPQQQRPNPLLRRNQYWV